MPDLVNIDHGHLKTARFVCRQAGANALNTFYSVKRFIGRDLEDLPKYAAKQVGLKPQSPALKIGQTIAPMRMHCLQHKSMSLDILFPKMSET